jgi:hypothetical protein
MTDQILVDLKQSLETIKILCEQPDMPGHERAAEQ